MGGVGGVGGVQQRNESVVGAIGRDDGKSHADQWVHHDIMHGVRGAPSGQTRPLSIRGI